MDELAKLNVGRNGKVYCIKVFENDVHIQQESGGDNHTVNRIKFPVYNETGFAWDIEVLGRLIDLYQTRKIREQIDRWTDEGGAPPPPPTT
jgi:hypothetical protein